MRSLRCLLHRRPNRVWEGRGTATCGMAKMLDRQSTNTSPEELTDEVVDQLKKLAELRDAGVLTDKEFAAKKAKLLP